MALSLKSTYFLQKSELCSAFRPSRQISSVPIKRFKTMATLNAVSTVGLSETFTRLRKQGKVSISTLGSRDCLFLLSRLGLGFVSNSILSLASKHVWRCLICSNYFEDHISFDVWICGLLSFLADRFLYACSLFGFS